jgi:hypothetical protein
VVAHTTSRFDPACLSHKQSHLSIEEYFSYEQKRLNDTQSRSTLKENKKLDKPCGEDGGAASG